MTARARIAALAAALVVAPLPALAVPQAGRPAPPLSLPGLPGHPAVSLAALRGKPVYVNFFASWCGPCNAEAPSIGAIARRYAKRGLEVVGVDELDPPGRGAAFVAKYHDPYDLVAIDDSGSVGQDYGAIALPVHVFIDRNGVVKLFRMGEMTPAQIDAAVKSIL